MLLLVDLLAVETGTTAAADRGLDLDVHARLGHSSYDFFRTMSFIGGGLFRSALVAAGVITLFLLRRYVSLIALLVVTAGAAILDELIKDLVRRPRPHLFPHATAAGGYSFPSGHSTNALAFYAVAALLIWNLSDRNAIGIAVSVVGAAIVLLVGLSRVVLGVHYPTDVIGGFLLGASWTALILSILGGPLRAETSGGPWVPSRLRTIFPPRRE